MVRKDPRPADARIGGLVRARRLVLGLSQEGLATKLGITFQQVQKYEKGTNRISGSRIEDIARVLDTTVGALHGEIKTDSPSLVPGLTDVLSSQHGIAIIRALAKLDNSRSLRIVREMVELIAKEEADAL